MSQQTTVAGARRLAEAYTRAWCSHQPEAVAAFYTENGWIVVNGGEEGRNVGLSVERREEDVITGITSDVGELGVEAGSEEARCRQKAAKESMMVLPSRRRG